MINVNHVVLVGRLTKDIELRKTNSNISTCSFTVAVDKRFNSQQPGAQTADFINCVAWRQSAEFLANYATKGTIVSVEGRIQTRNYEGQNGRVYVTEVVADNVQIISNRNSTQNVDNSYANNRTFTPSVEPAYSQNEQEDYNEVESFDLSNISSDDLPFY